MKSGRWRGHVGYLWLSGRTITANFFPHPDTPLQPVLAYYLPPTPSTCLFVFSPLWPHGQTRPLQKILVKQNRSHRWDARGLVKVDPKGHPQVSLPLVHSVSFPSLWGPWIPWFSHKSPIFSNQHHFLLPSVPNSHTFPFHSQPCALSSSHLVMLHSLPVPVSALPCSTGKTLKLCHLFLFYALCCSPCNHLP